MASNLIKTSSLVLAALVALTVQVFYFSPIDPVILEIPSAASSTSSTKNNQLQNVIKLGEGFLKQPEDVCVDKDGILYTATRDGWIKRMVRNGNWENWKHIDSSSLLGITTSKDGGLIVCDATKGLLKVTEEEGFSVILSQVNGSQLMFADDVIEASDGNIYFSVPSTKFGMHNWYLDVLEARSHGQLLRYNPLSNETVIVLDHLAFANGVALSKDEDYLLVCETWKFRCLKYWLKGINKGKTEIFIENLPAGPDNINLAPDGSFWIALIQITSEKTGFVHTSKVFKHLIALFPRLFNLISSATKSAMVVKVDIEGNIIKKFGDDNGKIIDFVTSAIEFEDHLYLGSIKCDFVGKFPLQSA
ncbi:putative strictosidine synthase transcription factor WD40-like family [Medicago truncatula]|uniref:Adipocyte plasma membrane-associated-like protein n=1 Tax=Medicago truncatula TaxID=3880 RepID=G7IGG1_MEDTR|nr:protein STRICTOSIDINE SYNTHASE-LIKE 5 isoform X1 [Medicago truncatula]AES65563.1 adipocyte plasma membrane-associated-like protein [Medicago truncatula]RHN73652.1 putative strictosidine synthase transcription factor WD40-like family [Medicago truncatula]